MVGNELSISTWLTSQTNLASCIFRMIRPQRPNGNVINEERLSTRCKLSSWKEALQNQSLHLFLSILAARK